MLKTFITRLIFCALALVLNIGPSLAQSVEEVFTIRNITVDVTDRSAARARTLALSQAEKQAFDTLMLKLLKPEDIEKVKFPDGLSYQNYLLGFEVADEKNSTRRYLATLNYTFNPELIRELFGSLNIPYSEISGRPFLFLPIYKRAGLYEIWSDDNPLVQYFHKIDQTNNLIRFQLPTASFQDRLTILGRNVINGLHNDRFEALRDRHSAEDVVIGLYTEELCADNQPCVKLSHWSMKHPENVKQLTVLQSAKPDDAIISAINSLVEDTQTQWKLDTLTYYGQYQQITAEMRFETIEQWVDLKQRLQKISLIQQVSIDEITYPRLALTIRHLGGLEQLKLGLSQQGLSIEPINALDRDPDMPENSWRIITR